MPLKITAPTRIDLSGGTLDIFPLYIFEEGGLTVNMAINLPTTVEISPRNDKKIKVYSKDLKKEIAADNIDLLETNGSLDLIARAIHFFKPETGLEITTESSVPHGSGLAASSSLLVALMYGLCRVCGKEADPHKFIDWCANIEARSLGIPTGKQDYYSAYFGGISAIHFTDHGITHENSLNTKLFLNKISECVVLSFTGISHFSGTNNWNMMKSYIDGNQVTRDCMRRIKATSSKMWEAIKKESLTDIASALKEEWSNRQCLAEGVTNEKVDSIIFAAEKANALASKICGAGGGGCLVTVCRPEDKANVEKSIAGAGAQILPFYLSHSGVTIKES